MIYWFIMFMDIYLHDRLEQSIAIQPPTSMLANNNKASMIARRCFTVPTKGSPS